MHSSTCVPSQSESFSQTYQIVHARGESNTNASASVHILELSPLCTSCTRLHTRHKKKMRNGFCVKDTPVHSCMIVFQVFCCATNGSIFCYKCECVLTNQFNRSVSSRPSISKEEREQSQSDPNTIVQLRGYVVVVLATVLI